MIDISMARKSTKPNYFREEEGYGGDRKEASENMRVDLTDDACIWGLLSLSSPSFPNLKEKKNGDRFR